MVSQYSFQKAKNCLSRPAGHASFDAAQHYGQQLRIWLVLLMLQISLEPKLVRSDHSTPLQEPKMPKWNICLPTRSRFTCRKQLLKQLFVTICYCCFCLKIYKIDGNNYIHVCSIFFAAYKRNRYKNSKQTLYSSLFIQIVKLSKLKVKKNSLGEHNNQDKFYKIQIFLHKQNN